MERHRERVSAVLIVAAACSSSPSTGTFKYNIDSALTPQPEIVAGATLAAFAGSGGKPTKFIVDEVLVTTFDAAALNDFVARSGGTIISSDEVPNPPLGSSIVVKGTQTPTFYVVKIDPAKFSTDGVEAAADKVGLQGELVVSSDAASQVIAGIIKERANSDLNVAPNAVGDATAIVFSSAERDLGSGTREDGLGYPYFQNTGSKTGVKQMMQLVAQNPPARRSSVAIIDGGFWLDSSGNSLSADLPAHPTQYDFVGDDYIADGENPTGCSGGSSCPWHGTGAAHTATGSFNNSFGSAGTAGQVADPMLFKTRLFEIGGVARSIRTAVAWGADVISMSFGIACDNFFCDWVFEDNIYAALRNARDSGVVMTAAAGNDDGNNANGHIPCKSAENVICVGALQDGSNTRFHVDGWWGSDYGSAVDIWAPTNIMAVYGGSGGPAEGGSFGGTSASTPFVAGIAAVMRAYNASLTSAQIEDALRTTGWADSPDGNVGRYINAFAAVRSVAPANHPVDALEPNNSSAAASNLGALGTAASPTTRNALTITNAADRDHYRFTLSEYASLDFSLSFVPELGNIDVLLVKESGATGSAEGMTNVLRGNGRGRQLHFDLTPPGTYRLVASGTAGNAYDLSAARTDRPLAPDAYEDNNTLGTARLISLGGRNANLHSLTDVDVYSINALAPTALQRQTFRISHSEVPITLQVYDSTSTLVSTITCGSDCSVNLPGGLDKVQVAGNGLSRGRYSFSTMIQVDVAALLPGFQLYPGRPFHLLNSYDQIPAVFEGQPDVFVFKQVGKFSSAILIGLDQAFKVSLYDASGNLIRTGDPSTDPQSPGMKISLAGTNLNESYVLVVEGKLVPAVIDGETGLQADIPYAFGLSNI